MHTNVFDKQNARTYKISRPYAMKHCVHSVRYNINRDSETFSVLSSGLQIYGGPRSLSNDFKIWPITFQGSGPSGSILFSCEKIYFNKNIHLTASLRTPQNRKYM